jgi:hypothetical protein
MKVKLLSLDEQFEQYLEEQENKKINKQFVKAKKDMTKRKTVNEAKNDTRSNNR